jgi:tyrosyl-tRNA synthetase
MSAELLADLDWRGLIAQSTDREELLKELNRGSTAFYIGFDPTAPSLHLGNLVVFLVMIRFENYCNKKLAVRPDWLETQVEKMRNAL